MLGRYPYRNVYLLHFISACRFKIYRKTDDLVRGVFLIRESHISWHSTCAKIHLATSDKDFGKHSRRHVLPCLSRVQYYVFQTSFLSEQPYFKYMEFSTTYQSSTLFNSWYQSDLSSQMKCNKYRKILVLS